MHSSVTRWIHAVLWVVMALFFILSGAAALLLHGQVRSPSDACGKCVTQELRIMLNFVATVSVASVAGLACLASQVRGRMWLVFAAGVLSAATIIGFAIFGAWFFREVFAGQQISKLIWWMF